MRKFLIVAGSVFGVVAGYVSLITKTAAAQLTTSTLGTSIDSVNSTWYDYFSVLLTKYWPFLVGALILVMVWAFGKRILMHFMH